MPTVAERWWNSSAPFVLFVFWPFRDPSSVCRSQVFSVTGFLIKHSLAACVRACVHARDWRRCVSVFYGTSFQPRAFSSINIHLFISAVADVSVDRIEASLTDGIRRPFQTETEEAVFVTKSWCLLGAADLWTWSTGCGKPNGNAQ